MATINYTVSLPPRMLEFKQSIVNDGFEKQVEDMPHKGTSILIGIAEYLDNSNSKFEEILHQEKSEFEMRNNPVGSNRLWWDLLLQSSKDEQYSSIIASALAVLHNNPSLFSSSADENRSLQVSLDVVGKAKYCVVCLIAKRFNDLRALCCQSEAAYIASLARSKPWAAQGGKSKSTFAKTMDDRLIIKHIYKSEFHSFSEFGSQYFHHINQSFKSGTPTSLAKILGFYQVIIKENKSETSHYLMVMENLSYNHKVAYHYDLKGAPLRSNNGEEDVRLDGLFVNDMRSSPLSLTADAKRSLEEAVLNDITFLDSINVMDYSLLVGVDRENGVLACGIIDYLRQYNNRYRNFISPKDYHNRFTKFITQHFLQ